MEKEINSLIAQLRVERYNYRVQLQSIKVDEYMAFYKGKIEVLSQIIIKLELLKSMAT